MAVPYTLQAPGEQVINEIQYYIAFSALTKLLEQGRITTEQCRQANAAIAEKYGVPLWFLVTGIMTLAATAVNALILKHLDDR